MLSEQQGRDPRVMSAALRRLTSQPPPSEAVVPGLLDGMPSVNRLAKKWLDRGRTGRVRCDRVSAPEPCCYIGRAPGACCVCSERLSAVVRDLYRAGDPGARAARAWHPYRLAAPSDRSHRSPGARRDRGRPALPSRIFLPGAVARLARLAAGATATGLSPARCAPGLPICGATLPQTACAGLVKRWCLRPSCPSDVEPSPCPFSAYAGFGRALRGADLGPRLEVSAHAKDIWTTPDWEKRESSAKRAGR